MIPEYKSVSYILVWADTNTMYRNDSLNYTINKEVDKALLDQTMYLIDQILQLNPHEILIMDNEGNFPTHKNPLVKVIPSYQSVGYLDGERPEWLDKINIEDYREDTDFNHAKSLAMAYNHGLTIATGDYFIIQHNDTRYLFDNFDSYTLIYEFISELEDGKYEYITIDKKPPKSTSPDGYNYFADCYWFLCRKDFYSKHNIWVDWKRGDNNHLATITCEDKELRYLHLPGFFETEEHKPEKFNRKYYFGSKSGNLHIFRDKPFLLHFKGGTGLHRVLAKNR